jgi:hypothetical protein
MKKAVKGHTTIRFVALAGYALAVGSYGKAEP